MSGVIETREHIPGREGDERTVPSDCAELDEVAQLVAAEGLRDCI